jgi:hypothetical protein
VVVVAGSLRCLNLTSVFLYLTSGCVAEVERVGGDAGDAAVILSLDRSGRRVWGSGIVGRMGRIGAVGVSVLASGGLASGLGGGITVISSSLLTSSTELSRVTKFGVLTAMT